MLTSLITLADGLDSLGQHEASNALDSLLKYAANRSDEHPTFRNDRTILSEINRLYGEIDNLNPDDLDAYSALNKLRLRIDELQQDRGDLRDALSEEGSYGRLVQRHTGQRAVDYRNEQQRLDDEYQAEQRELDNQSEVDHFNDEIYAEEIADEALEDDVSDNRSDSMPLYKEYAELMRKSDRIKQKMDELSVNSEEFDELDARRNAIHDRIDALMML